MPTPRIKHIDDKNGSLKQQRTVFYLTPSVNLLGANTSLLQLLSHIDRKRFRPVVCCPKDGPLIQRLHEIDVTTRIIRFGSWRKVKYWPLIPTALYNLTDFARKEHAVLWHSNEFWSFPYSYFSARRLRIPAICHFRCSRNPEQIPPSKIRKYFLHHAERIIAISHAQRVIFKEIPEVDGKLDVIPNGLDITPYDQASGIEFRKELGVASHELLIGMIGAISEHKGVEEFLRAAAKIAHQMDNMRLVLVGPSNSREYLEHVKQLSRELHLDNRLSIHGFRSDIPDIMNALDLLVTPSRQEAFGRVIIEAMASRTPVIATKVGGIPEIISSPDYGVLVPPRDVDALAKEILTLSNNPVMRKHMGNRARKKIEKDFSIQRHAARIQEVYEKVLAG